ncbi:MAG: hypothetical protein IKP64_06295 [Selenomonadaceae bacterium]|nr:hypothetical protein [Selenomonadaceae bacterium]MBR4383153.1 hypothetical protein [Selenomonadaceae bacterium]
MKLDTSKDRLSLVKKFYLRGGRIGSELRKARQINFGDVFGLMAMMEKLDSLEEMIRTERILEETAINLLKVPDETAETRKKFSETFGDGAENFLKTILLPRIDALINFTDNDFVSKRLMDFQKDLREGMTELLDKYKEIYEI